MNRPKKRAFFRKRSHTAPSHAPRTLSVYVKNALKEFQRKNPAAYSAMFTRRTKRGRMQFTGH